MGVYWSILGGVLLLAIVTAVIFGVRNGWRFGRVFGATKVVDGSAPYRASAHRTLEHRGIPKTVWLASMSAIVWGLITLGIFVPSGSLLAVMLMSNSQGAGPLAGFVLGVICLAALPLSFMLFVHASRLLKRDTSQLEGFVRWAVGHHVVVLLYFLALGLATEQVEGFAVALFFVGVPCLLGVLQAMAMSAAQNRLHGIVREEGSGLALPPEPLVA